MANKEDVLQSYKQGYSQGKEDTLYEIDKMIDKAINSNLDEVEKFKQLKIDFENLYAEDLPRWGKSEPTPYEKKHCFTKKYTYRGIKTDIYCDDCGQSYYFYLDGRCINCGSYNMFPEEVIRYEIDEKLDVIARLADIDEKYAGAYIRYTDKKHTKAFLKYRGEEISGVPTNAPVDFQIQFCTNILDKLFSTPSFIESEKERKESGALYFNELIEKINNEEKEEEDN